MPLCTGLTFPDENQSTPLDEVAGRVSTVLKCKTLQTEGEVMSFSCSFIFKVNAKSLDMSWESVSMLAMMHLFAPILEERWYPLFRGYNTALF